MHHMHKKFNLLFIILINDFWGEFIRLTHILLKKMDHCRLDIKFSIDPCSPFEPGMGSDRRELTTSFHEVAEEEDDPAAYDNPDILNGVEEDRVEYVDPSGVTATPVDLEWPAERHRRAREEEIGQHVGEDRQETNSKINPGE